MIHAMRPNKLEAKRKKRTQIWKDFEWLLLDSNDSDSIVAHMHSYTIRDTVTPSPYSHQAQRTKLQDNTSYY